MNKKSPYLTVDEAAKHFRVDRHTICRWIKNGRLPAVVTPGGRYRIHKDDLILALKRAPRSSRGGERGQA